MSLSPAVVLKYRDHEFAKCFVHANKVERLENRSVTKPLKCLLASMRLSVFE